MTPSIISQHVNITLYLNSFPIGFEVSRRVIKDWLLPQTNR